MDNTENLSVSEVQPASEADSLSSNKLCPLEDNLNVGSTSSENKLETDESEKSEDEEFEKWIQKERKFFRRENKKFEEKIKALVDMKKKLQKVIAARRERSRPFRRTSTSANKYKKKSSSKSCKIPGTRTMKTNRNL